MTSCAGATCAPGSLGALSAERKINNQRPDPVRPTPPPSPTKQRTFRPGLGSQRAGRGGARQATERMRVRRAVRDRSAAQSTSRGCKERSDAQRRRSGVQGARMLPERATPERSATARTAASRRRAEPAASGEATGAEPSDEGAGAATKRALRGPRYVLRPDASGRVARFPRAPGHADPAEGAQRPEPQGDQRERVRRPAARPKAQRRPQVRRRLRRARLPCRAQRRAGAHHGGRLDVSGSERGRRRARCPPPSARATAPRRPSARPDRYLTARRAFTLAARQRGE